MDVVIAYVENPKEVTKNKQTKQRPYGLSDYNKVAGYKDKKIITCFPIYQK